MRTLKIPDAWLMGYCQSHPGATVQDAIAWWLYQERLEDEYQLQRWLDDGGAIA